LKTELIDRFRAENQIMRRVKSVRIANASD
jgi:hypothetical protein